MRSSCFCMMAIAIAIVLVAQPVAALTTLQVPYVRAGPVWFLGPAENSDLVILETNADHLAVSDTETFTLSFSHPLDNAGEMVFSPALAQTSSRTIACSRSYFYQDFLNVA